MDKLMARADLNTQPYFMHFVFDALNHSARFEQHAVTQMKRWRIFDDTQTYREMWNGGDYSHAWGGTPLIQMSSRILGVEPLKPGFKSFVVRPQPCGLDWAKGIVPTPHGDIAVSWTRANGELKLELTVPAGCEAEVISSKKKRFGPGNHEIISRN
jgi:hypothetical protein